MRRLRRPVLAAALVTGLIGCTAGDKGPPPSAAPEHVASAPVPAAPAERPPVPKRKPAAPATQTASVASDAAAAAPAANAPADPAVAALESAPSTPEKSNDSVPNDLVGMESSAIEQSLGPPESRRDVPPAVVWEYANDACGLDIWLYRDLQSGALRALFVEVKGDDTTDQRRQFCIKQLALQSAGGTRRPTADEAAPR